MMACPSAPVRPCRGKCPIGTVRPFFFGTGRFPDRFPGAGLHGRSIAVPEGKKEGIQRKSGSVRQGAAPGPGARWPGGGAISFLPAPTGPAFRRAFGGPFSGRAGGCSCWRGFRLTGSQKNEQRNANKHRYSALFTCFLGRYSVLLNRVRNFFLLAAPSPGPGGAALEATPWNLNPNNS